MSATEEVVTFQLSRIWILRYYPFRVSDRGRSITI